MNENLNADNKTESSGGADKAAQRKILKLGNLGAVISVGVLAWGYFMLAGAVPAITGTGDRLAFALLWIWIPVIILQLGVSAAGGARFKTKHTDGSPPPTGSRLDIHRRFITNTVEQLAIFIPLQLVLVTILPDDRLAIIPVWAVLFFVARLIFWIGYLKNPLYRAVGFLMTTTPSIIALFYIALRVTGVI